MGRVCLHVYDLSKGLLGNKLGLWHSAIYVYETEFEYGPLGIVMRPKELIEDDKFKEIPLGETNVDLGTLMSYMHFLSKKEFPKEKYNLFSYNCNYFANFLSNQLVGANIPEYLLYLPATLTRVISVELMNVVLHLLRRRVSKEIK